MVPPATRWALLGGRLPSLDVHLIRRGAILHLTLGGGACGAEKQRSTLVSREGRLANTPGIKGLSLLSWPVPQEKSLTFQQWFSYLSNKLQSPRPRSHPSPLLVALGAST